MPGTKPDFLHIAAGVLQNARGDVLICQRPAHKLYPGEWEFPGGKVEPGEDVQAALARELREELGIRVTAARPLIRLRHVYPELSVDLDTWLVTRFDGEPVSTEHPATAWVAPGALPGWRLLAADRPIVNALRLPPRLIVTPPDADAASLQAGLARLPAPALLRLRLPRLSDDAYGALARELAPRCAALGLSLLVDRDPERVVEWGAAGWQGSAAAIRSLTARPLPADRWFGASCHDEAERAAAAALGADFTVLGPVRQTATHPSAPALGWETFARLARGAGMPVYAIGGLVQEDLPRAWAHGAQGIAGISAYWRVSGSSGGGASGSGSAGIA